MTAANLNAVLLGDKERVKGGSGKVVDSKADDRIFIYYTDHGGPGILGEFRHCIYISLMIWVRFTNYQRCSCFRDAEFALPLC